MLVYQRVVRDLLVGGFKHDFNFHFKKMECHPKPIDEVHHFSRL